MSIRLDLSRSPVAWSLGLFISFPMASSSCIPDPLQEDPETLNVDLFTKNQNSKSLSNKALVGKVRTQKKLNVKVVKKIIAKA